MKRMSKTMAIFSLLFAVAIIVTCNPAPASAGDCAGPVECLGTYGMTIETQAQCELVQEHATYDARWKCGLSTEVDHDILGCDVAAYRIQWFNGSWSQWFVTGINDIDPKFNEPSSGNQVVGSLRRMWAYFYDHDHEYIVCCRPDSACDDVPQGEDISSDEDVDFRFEAH